MYIKWMNRWYIYTPCVQVTRTEGVGVHIHYSGLSPFPQEFGFRLGSHCLASLTEMTSHTTPDPSVVKRSWGLDILILINLTLLQYYSLRTRRHQEISDANPAEIRNRKSTGSAFLLMTLMSSSPPQALVIGQIGLHYIILQLLRSELIDHRQGMQPQSQKNLRRSAYKP